VCPGGQIHQSHAGITRISRFIKWNCIKPEDSFDQRDDFEMILTLFQFGTDAFVHHPNALPAD
jgi:hypothetical protein